MGERDALWSFCGDCYQDVPAWLADGVVMFGDHDCVPLTVEELNRIYEAAAPLEQPSKEASQ